jgi:hypothetical protein
VGAGLAIPGLRRACEPLNRLLPRELEVTRPLGDEVLEVLAVTAILELQPTSPERVDDRDRELGGAKRLDDVPVGSELEGVPRQFCVVEAADHHDGGTVLLVGKNCARQLEPRLVGELAVAEHEFEPLLGESGPGVRGRRRLHRRMPFRLDDPPHGAADARLVDNDQNVRQ